MPRYDYVCNKCRIQIEHTHSIKTDPTYRCVCGRQMVRKIGNPSIHWQGGQAQFHSTSPREFNKWQEESYAKLHTAGMDDYKRKKEAGDESATPDPYLTGWERMPERKELI